MSTGHPPPAGSPDLLRRAVAVAASGIAVLDASGRHLEANEAFCRLTGYSAETLASGEWPPPYCQDDRDRKALRAAFDRVLLGDAVSLDLSFAGPTGVRRMGAFAFTRLGEAPPGPEGAGHSPSIPVEQPLVVVTAYDVTELRVREAELASSQEKWRSVAENPFDFVVIIDREYRYLYINHTFPGLAREDLIGHKTPFDFVDPSHHRAMRECFEKAFLGRPQSYEVYAPQLDAWFSTIVGPILEGGVVTSLSLLTRDISEGKRATEAVQKNEHRLRHTQRLETLGTLASGIAHDFNNALVPIVACSQMILADLSPSHPLYEDVETIAIAATRARELVTRILTFSRRAEDRREIVNMAVIAREALLLLRSSFPSTVVFDVRIDEPLPLIPGDPAQLHQLLTNLCTNACQAIGTAGGHVRIAIEERRVSPSLAARLSIKTGAAVRVSVEDDGPGMTRDVIERAFDPFFTTKPAGEGTGLGLSIAHAVVASHGGAIDVQSAPGEGALFQVYLPARPLTGEESVAPEARVHAPRKVSILLVDDDVMVLRTWARVLALEGHAVTTAASGKEALARIEANDTEFELVVTDHTMPGMTGLALIRRLAELVPAVPVVLVSGLGEDALSGPRPPNLRLVLAKPASPAELHAGVRRAIGP